MKKKKHSKKKRSTSALEGRIVRMCDTGFKDQFEGFCKIPGKIRLMCWLIFNSWLWEVGGREAFLICSIWQFLGCEYSHRI